MKINLLINVLMMIINVNYCHKTKVETTTPQKETRKAQDFYNHYNKIKNTDEGQKKEKDMIDQHIKQCKKEGHDHQDHLKPENFSAKFSVDRLYQKSNSVIATMLEHQMPIQEKFTENFKQSISLIPGKPLFKIQNDKEIVYEDAKENINITFTLLEKNDLKDFWVNNTLLENLEHFFHEGESMIDKFHEKIIYIANSKEKVDFEMKAPVSLLYSFAKETNNPQIPIEFYAYFIINVPVLKNNQPQKERETFIFKSNDANFNPINLDTFTTVHAPLLNKFDTSVKNQLKDHKIQFTKLPIVGFYTIIIGPLGFVLYKKFSHKIPIFLKKNNS